MTTIISGFFSYVCLCQHVLFISDMPPISHITGLIRFREAPRIHALLLAATQYYYGAELLNLVVGAFG